MLCCARPRWHRIWAKLDIARGKAHLTNMNMQTRVSAKGQVVIPKDVRERLRWVQGQPLDVVETPDGVLLKRPRVGQTLSLAEALARIKARASYAGPPVSTEDMKQAIASMFENAKDERF